MDLRVYQTAVLKGMHIREDAGRIPHAALGLAGEAGEVCDIIKKSQYDKAGPIDIPHLIEELGDTLWYLTFLAGVYGYSLDELASLNIEKLKKRRPDVYGGVPVDEHCPECAGKCRYGP